MPRPAWVRGQVQPRALRASGWTGNPTVPYAKSIMDYIFRWMGARFIGPEYTVTEAGDAPVLRHRARPAASATVSPSGR